MSSFKSSENIQKKECGPDRSVWDNQSSSVTLNKLAMKARKSYCNFNFKQRSHTMTDSNLNEVQNNLNCLEYMSLNLRYFLISQNISADLKGPKVKYKLHYGRCTGRFLGLPHGTTPAAVTTNKI